MGVPEINSMFLSRAVRTDAAFVFQQGTIRAAFLLVGPNGIQNFPTSLGRNVLKLHAFKNIGVMKAVDFVRLTFEEFISVISF